MKEAVTGKAWAMYDETGVVLSLCRHGFCLVMADMVRSGEMYVFFTSALLALLKCFSVLGRSMALPSSTT
jgi:hypothetical protein